MATAARPHAVREQRRKGLTAAKVPGKKPLSQVDTPTLPVVGSPGRGHRDRHGRGARGPLTPPHVPLRQTPTERFDEIVLDAVEHVERRWRERLGSLDFAVEEVPPADVGGPFEDEIASAGVPLARLFPPAAGRRARIVIYRRPLELRAIDREDLEDLVHDIVVEEVAHFLGMDPHDVDPEGFPPDE